MIGLLLAAGAGRRLGGPKARLDLAGLSALARCLAALREGGATPLRAVLRPDDDASAVEARQAGAEIVLAHGARASQTSSLQAALRAGPSDPEGFLLHVVDQPLVEARDVAAILAAFRGRPAGIAIVVPVAEGHRGHPVAWAPEVAREMLALGADEPAHAVVRRDPSRVLELELPNPWLSRDLDEPRELAAALEALRARG